MNELFNMKISRDDEGKYYMETNDNIEEFDDLTACYFKIKELNEMFNELWNEQVNSFFEDEE